MLCCIPFQVVCPIVVLALLTAHSLLPVIAPQDIHNDRLWPTVATHVTSAEVVQLRARPVQQHAHHIIVAMVTVMVSATVLDVPTIMVIALLHLLHLVLKPT